MNPGSACFLTLYTENPVLLNMKKLPTYLLLSLIAVQTIPAAGAAEPGAEDYTLSMAGALINDHCERNWQDAAYVNKHACNYDLANRYTLELSTAHFSECTVQANGDIVRIADCMVARFTAWLSGQTQ